MNKSPVCDITLTEVIEAYYQCRKNKRNTNSQLEFEINLEENIYDLYQDLINGAYEIGQSICFVITSPNVREIWAAAFRDRIVQHVIYNIISPPYNKSFIYDSCACIPERGTLFAAERLGHHIRKCSDNWNKETYYLKMDISNFFVSINKDVVWDIMEPVLKGRHPQWVVDMTHYLLFHDPRTNPLFKSTEAERSLVETRKRLELCDNNVGLPIGNLLSQFIANVLMDVLDKFVKHDLKIKHYVRYVDDFILIHNDKDVLKSCIPRIKEVVETLSLRINPRKTLLHNINRGVSFVGTTTYPYVKLPYRKTIKRMTRGAIEKNDKGVFNSIIGWLSQSKSHHERMKMLRLAMRMGNSVKFPLSYL